MTPRQIKLPTAYKTKPRICPICNKRTLFVRGNAMQCKTCHYRNER